MSARALLRRKLRRDLRRRRAQVVAVGLTVFVGIAVFIVTAGMASNLGGSYDLTYERTSFADLWITGGAPDLAQRLEALDGVGTVEQRTSADIGVQFADRPIRTRIVGFDDATTLNTLVITSGDGLSGSARGVVLEQHTADHFGLGPGDFVTIVGVGTVEVLGAAASPEWLWVAPTKQELVDEPDDFAVIFAPESLAASVAPDGRQLVVAMADRSPDLLEAVAAVAVGSGAGEVLTRTTHPSNNALQNDLKGFEQLSVMFPALFLGAAGLATAVLLSRLVTQQRAEIGMLRANGYPTGVIQRHFATYGVVVALVGAVPAIPLGVIGGWLGTRAYTDFLGIPFASRSLHPVTWGLGVAFAAGVGALSGSIAARRATAVDPATAMRPGGGVVAGKRVVLERLVPRRSPNWLRLGVRNIGRAPGRAATTALGIVLALVLTMTAFVLNDTINDIFTTQFTEIDSRGLIVTLDGAPDAGLTAALAAIDGVSTVEPHLELGASLVAGDRVATEQLQIFRAGTELHDFDAVGGLPPAGIVLSIGAAERLGVTVGDQLEVRALDGTSGTVTVASIVIEPFAGSSYLSTATWDAIGGPPPDTLAIGLLDRQDHDRVREAITGFDRIDRISDRIATAERAEELLAASRFFVGVVLFLSVVMAIALIFNALAVTIGERETEVATLQANGVGRSWIRRTVTAENLVTVGLGLVPGLVIGRLSAGLFISQFSTDQFRLDPVLRPTSLIAAGVLLAACALVAQIPGLRRLDRLDLATKVRERAL